MLDFNNWGRRQEARIPPLGLPEAAELAALGLKVLDQGEKKQKTIFPFLANPVSDYSFSKYMEPNSSPNFLTPRPSSNCQRHPVRLAEQDFILISLGEQPVVQRSDQWRDPQPLGSRGRPRASISLPPSAPCLSSLISDLHIYFELLLKLHHF